MSALVERLINERRGTGASPSNTALPVWHLGTRAICTGVTSTTMSVEPGIIDANVLVYAMDADSPHHTVSRALLEAARNASTTL